MINVAEKHQRRIAKATLKMSDAGARIMGGMTKADARKFLGITICQSCKADCSFAGKTSGIVKKFTCLHFEE